MYNCDRLVHLWVSEMMLNAQSVENLISTYCLVYGQMSHWGTVSALNILIIYIIINKYKIYTSCTSRHQVTNYSSPLSEEILSIITGSLLGDGHAEKRKGGIGTRISFYQEGSHKDYLLYLHSLIANLGYCNTNTPKIYTRLGNNGKIRSVIRFHTWTYTQFNIIHNIWYKLDQKDNKYIKILPKNIDLFLTPLAIAIWIMDDGSKSGKGLKLATNNFTYEEVNKLINILYSKYNVKSSIISAGVSRGKAPGYQMKNLVPNQYYIYVFVESMPILTELVKKYIIPSMKYKFGDYL